MSSVWLTGWLTRPARTAPAWKLRPRVRPRLEALEDRSTPTVVALNPVADNTLYEDPTGNLSNGAGTHFYVGNTAQAAPASNARRGLLRFDFSSIPAGSTIDSAALALHVSKVPNGAQPESVELHRTTAAWGEGTSNAATGGTGGGEGDGIQATTNDATWTFSFFNTTSWASAGGDFDPTILAATTVTGINSYQWTGLTAVVQQSLDTPATNLGWLLLGNEVTPKTGKQFDSRENATLANRPTLTVDFTAPPADLTMDKSHAGNFTQGDPNDTYTIAVANVGTGPTVGTVTVTDTVPTGMTPTAVNTGVINGWTVSTIGQTVTASRSDALAAGTSYPNLPIVVAVDPAAPSSLTNTAAVAGGGETNTANDSDPDPTTIVPPVQTSAPVVTISSPSQTITNQVGSVTYTVTYTDDNLAAVALKAANVIVNATGTASADVTVSGTGNVRTVVLNNIRGEGTLGISIPAGTAIDLDGNPAGPAGPSATFIADNTLPAVTIDAPSVATTAAGPVSWLVTVADAHLVTPVVLSPAQVQLVGSPATIAADVAVDLVNDTQVRVRLTNIRGGSGTLAVRLPTGWATDRAGNPSPATNSPPVAVTGSAKLRLAAAGPAIARTGGTITYLVAYRTAGTQQADGVELIVALPAGTTFNRGGSTTGWTAIGNGRFRLKLGNLATGAHAKVRFSVVVGPTNPPNGRVVFGVSITDDLAEGIPLLNRTVVSRVARSRVG